MLFAGVFTIGLATILSSNSAEATVEASGGYDEVQGSYYYYNGHTGYNQDGAFILEQLFINGLDNNNFTLNGYWINAHPDANDEHSHTQDVYDQTLYVNMNNEVYRASFPINNPAENPYATLASITSAYGEPNESTVENGDGEYQYIVGNGQITFTFDDGLVTHVHVGSKGLE